MTHMQLFMMGLWQAVAPVAFAGLCVFLFILWRNHRNDDDDGDAPALLVEEPQKFPFGFHRPKGASA